MMPASAGVCALTSGLASRGRTDMSKQLLRSWLATPDPGLTRTRHLGQDLLFTRSS